jgi:hypothetical protein
LIRRRKRRKIRERKGQNLEKTKLSLNNLPFLKNPKRKILSLISLKKLEVTLRRTKRHLL